MTEKYIPQILNVLTWPDDGLHVKCEEVTTFDKELEHLAADMFATMGAYGGVGLAAPQVGHNINMFVLRIEENNPMVFVNPKIDPITNEKYLWEEGCLSVPGYFEKRRRPATILSTFQNVIGEEQSVQFGKLYAFAIQHECDHLEGKVFVDNVSFLKKSRIKNKIKKTKPRFEQRVELMKQTMVNQELEGVNSD